MYQEDLCYTDTVKALFVKSWDGNDALKNIVNPLET